MQNIMSGKRGFSPLEKNPSHLRQGGGNKFDQDLKPVQEFQTGFTLIELMIVIIIIAIFAAIIIPLVGGILQSSGDSDSIEIEDQDSESEKVEEPAEKEEGGNKL